MPVFYRYIYIYAVYTHAKPCPWLPSFSFQNGHAKSTHIAQLSAALGVYLLKATCELSFFQTGVEQCVLFVLIDDLYIWFVKILFILYYTYYIYLKNEIK